MIFFSYFILVTGLTNSRLVRTVTKLKLLRHELIKFCSVFGLPRVIKSDEGSNFTSKLVKEVTKELGIEHQLSTTYHPE